MLQRYIYFYIFAWSDDDYIGGLSIIKLEQWLKRII